MTKMEALGLEIACSSLFAECGDFAEISMALTGKMKVTFEGPSWRPNFINFTLDGEPDYINFQGMAEDLFRVLAVIKSVCADDEKSKMLEQLKWSYEHVNELTEEEP